MSFLRKQESSWKRAKEFLRHGLAIQEDAPSPAESHFIEEIAKRVKEHHLTFPLLAFVEGLRPATGIATSVLTALEPFIELFVAQNTYAKLISFVGNRKNLDLLIATLEKQDKPENSL